MTEDEAVLSGEIEGQKMRDRAHDRAKAVEGVDRVRNDLRVRKPSQR